MSVLGCHIVLLQCTPGEASKGVTFECSWADDVPLCTGPETGEWLEAQGWEGLGYKIIVGTEDYDCFAKRLGPEIAISASQHSVLYSERGIRIQVGPLAGGVELSLHFVVSWNRSPDPADCSCWYAVGISHPTVLSHVHSEVG
ncbi:hypothetical protein [Acidovorax sp. LjRoot117]|uniref:hypothetical protein n=1 Tax=Acidovorax sp. LjRoot117 TaxID=3342255 RepID=UPI003ED03510